MLLLSLKYECSVDLTIVMTLQTNSNKLRPVTSVYIFIQLSVVSYGAMQ